MKFYRWRNVPRRLCENEGFRMGTDMVDTCQEGKVLSSNFIPAVLVVDKFQGTQRVGTVVTTIDHSDIRGLDTA